MSEYRQYDDEVRLEPYLDIVRRRRWTIIYTAVAVFTAGCVATALTKPTYEAHAKLLVRTSVPQINAMNTENPLVDLLAMAQPETRDTQIQVLQSQPFLDEVFTASGVSGSRKQPSVKAAGVGDTDVIEVTAAGPDPEAAARVANGMLDHYLERTSVLSLQEITRAREFVQTEEQKAQRALQHAEQALLEFRRMNRVAELTAEQQNRTHEVVDLETKVRQTNSSLERLQAETREIQAQLQREPPERVVFKSHENPRVDTLQTRLAEAEVERVALLKSYRPSHLKVRTLDATIASLRAKLAAEPLEVRVPLHEPSERYSKLVDRLDTNQMELHGLEAQRAQLEPQLAFKRQRLSLLGPWEIRLTQLQRDRDMAEKSYLELASKLQDLRIRENARRSTARVIERASPPTAPVLPHRTTNIVASLVLGLLLGGCLAFLLEVLDDRITSPDEIGRLLSLPVLGSIPVFPGNRRLIPALPPQSAVAEGYRGLRSSISFAAVDAPVTTLAVTSTRIGEGKSTTAVNLALAMAMDGREVILVDADLRRPTLDVLLGLQPSPGLTDVLTGQCSVEEALQPVPDHHLLALTSGPIPPNPAEMLNSAAMENVIRQLRQMASVVLFDTPPCLPVTDTQVLGAKLDGTLLVAEMGETRKGEVRRACELLDQAHIRLLGIVFNKISPQHGGYQYRTYYGNQYPSDGRRNGSGNGHLEEVELQRASRWADEGHPKETE